jgi:hypothetical protein
MDNKDWNSEFDRVAHYLNHMQEIMSNLERHSKDGQLLLSGNEVNTFCWLLTDCSVIAHDYVKFTDRYNDQLIRR